MATRSRRLRKKLCVEEFQELGCELSLNYPEGLSDEAVLAFFEALLDQVESLGLAYSGCDEYGFVALSRRGSVSSEQREALQAWLKGRTELSSCELGALEDIWHPGAAIWQSA